MNVNGYLWMNEHGMVLMNFFLLLLQKWAMSICIRCKK